VIDPQPFTETYQFTPTIPFEVGLKRLAAHLEQIVPPSAVLDL
jgi:hypothetical protein